MTKERLKKLEDKMCQIAKDCDMECDHTVGICCGWHYMGFSEDEHGNPIPLTHEDLLSYAKDLLKAMKETDKLNGGDLFTMESYQKLHEIIRELKKGLT